MIKLIALAMASVAVGGLFASAQAGDSKSSECFGWTQEVRLNGKASKKKFKDANGGPETAIILRLSPPICMKADFDFPAFPLIREVQITGSAAKTFPIGKTVLLTGRAAPAETAHHYTAVVVDNISIAFIDLPNTDYD